MKRDIFISWSGEHSKQIALCLRHWLPQFIQAITPWMSSVDLRAGTFWSKDLADRLKSSIYGIICVTPRNLASDWLLFEAGALSSTIASNGVCPFLSGIRPETLTGPLSQFQVVDSLDGEAVKRLLRAINNALGDDRLTDEQLNRSFDAFLKPLCDKLRSIRREIEREADTRLRLLDGKLNRTKQLVADLSQFSDSLTTCNGQMHIRYSGSLSVFAIPDEELNTSTSDDERNYHEELRKERDLLIEAAKHPDCVIRVIVTPQKPVATHNIHHITRLKCLQNFLSSTSKTLNIEWVVSSFRQKNVYIIDGVSYLEGFKPLDDVGYQHTLRYSQPDELNLNSQIFDMLFRYLERYTTRRYYPYDGCAGNTVNSREELRLATLKCVSDTLEKLGTAQHLDDLRAEGKTSPARRNELDAGFRTGESSEFQG